MLALNVIIVVGFAVLAILSRKHYSKYKDEKGIKGSLVAIGLAMGHGVWTFLVKHLPVDGLRSRLGTQLRKNQIVTPKGLELITDRFMAGCLGVGLGLLFTFNLLEVGSTLYNRFLRDEKNIIEREDYGGDVIEEEIYYELSGQEHMLVLNVSPVRLSEEEFYVKATELSQKVYEDYLYKGAVISQDLELPVSDSQGVFALSWESLTPEIISSRGSIRTELSQEPKEAALKLYISYYDYSVEYEFQVLVGAKERNEEELQGERLEQALCNLEQGTLEEKEIILPERMEEIKISLGGNQQGSGRFLALGLVLAVATFGVSISRLKEAGLRRDRQLMREYPFFVDSLWLYIEAGMNLRRAMKEYVSNGSVDSILMGEIRYTLNQIDNGEAEYEAYEELGLRLNLSVYVSLMRHISQNLRMGTRDLRALMETEVAMALEAKKETAKRLGEEASTKLVFPMIVLLVVVMVLIMTPAFMGF